MKDRTKGGFWNRFAELTFYQRTFRIMAVLGVIILVMGISSGIALQKSFDQAMNGQQGNQPFGYFPGQQDGDQNDSFNGPWQGDQNGSFNDPWQGNQTPPGFSGGRGIFGMRGSSTPAGIVLRISLLLGFIWIIFAAGFLISWVLNRRRLAAMRPCPNCGAPYEVADHYCSACGILLPPEGWNHQKQEAQPQLHDTSEANSL